MSTQTQTSAGRSTARIPQAALTPLTYRVTLTDSGEWMHAEGSDFLFAFVEKDWDKSLKQQVAEAFKAALKMSTIIKQAVHDTSGQTVENGLYLLDQTAMTKAMNSIPGMGETEVNQDSKSGSGTATTITGEFFSAVLGGLSGDVEPMLTYLTSQMGDLQVQTRKETQIKSFGTVIGLISVMPELDVVVTSFQYVFSSQKVSQWFVSVPCGSSKREAYDYSFTVVNYNYAPAASASAAH